MMKRGSRQAKFTPDEEMLQIWENMRIEILHELQEGAIADVPESCLNEIGNLVVKLDAWRAQQKPRLKKEPDRRGSKRRIGMRL